jgi:transposase, IS30 family
MPIMKYTQLSEEERHRIAALRVEGKSLSTIARRLGRAPSTISREVKRNRYPTDGRYRAYHAERMSRGRRSRARSGSRFGAAVWKQVEELLAKDWSPDQISGYFKKECLPGMSHETIYQYLLQDRRNGGDLWERLRGARKKRRKRYGAHDSRGRLAGKRSIHERPAAAERREATGHWEIDTVHGKGLVSILTLVDRKSGYVQIGLLNQRTAWETNWRLSKLMARHPGRYATITSDNGCEFHSYREIEMKSEVLFYFATPHHSWERGTSENTNGLIRQYLPKGTSFANLTQQACDAIARKLNTRPRKRLGYRTPKEVFNEAL